MTAWGRFVAARLRVVLAVSIVVFLGAGVYGLGVFDAVSSGGFAPTQAESTKARDVVEGDFGVFGPDVIVVHTSPDDRPASDPPFRDAVADVAKRLRDHDGVAAVIEQPPSGQPFGVSPDGSATMMTIRLAGDDEAVKSDHYTEVKDLLAAEGLTTHVAGAYAVLDDINAAVQRDVARAEIIALPVVFVLSIIIFGSLTAATMPVLVGATAVAGSFAAVRVLAQVTDVSVFAVNVITLLGMGLAVDYSLFIVSRFREELRSPTNPDGARSAVATAVATAGRTVMFSALVVAAALACVLVFDVPFLQSMGWGGMAAVLLAMVSSVTVLPAVLGLLGSRVDAGRIPVPWFGERANAGQVWARVGARAMRRPIAVAVGVSVALVALGWPFLGATFGGVDERVLAESSPSRVAMGVVADRFGRPPATASVVVQGATEQQASAYADRLRAVEDVDAVTVVGTRSEGQDWLLVASWEALPQDVASQDVVADLREVSRPVGATVLVGGESAAAVDLIQTIRESLPIMGIIVVVVMLVLLFMAFGSVVLPLKAVVMSTISLGASFGVVWWLFGEGHGASALQFTPLGYLEATQPILMLAIVFGLSMDYEVFLLSRVREEWDATGDNRAAVVAGLQRTGHIITSAALLFAVVIGVFSTASVQVMKLMGIGMLVAVLLDATVVRGLLVPATMRLLGRANWWAPAPMARWWQRYGHRETVAPDANVPGFAPVRPDRSQSSTPDAVSADG